MSDKITWWPASVASTLCGRTVVLMRHDWPDGQRVYELGIYDPSRKDPWTDAANQSIPAIPDFFVTGDQIVEFIKIPAEREFTYNPKMRKP